MYVEIEEQLTELLGSPDSLVLPTITLIHTSVIPVLAGQGAVLIDAQAHKTIYEGAAIARGAGATLHRVRTNDYEHLEETLRSLPAGVSRMFCIDGVNSMTGNVPDLPTYARICREYDTLLYVDDADGFGVIGESPTRTCRTAGAATALSSISGRHTTMSCWWRVSRSPTRHCSPFWHCRRR